MEELDNQSYRELMSEVDDCMSIMFEIINSPEEVSSIVSLAFLPYLSLICSGIQEFEGVDLNAPVIAGENAADIIRNIRLKSKLYSNDKSRKSINNILKSISQSKVDMIEGYNYFQLLRMKLFGQKNLGVFKYNNILFFNNIQGYEIISDLYSIEEESDTAIIKAKDIRDFAAYCSSYIYTFSELNCENHQSSLNDFDKISTCIKKEEISSEDYHFTMGGENKLLSETIAPEVGIFLLNIYCAINFVVHVLPKILKEDSNLYNRILLVCYISSAESLSRLVKNNNYHNGIPHDFIRKLYVFVETKRKLISSELRCNIFHFHIKESNVDEEEHKIISITNSTKSNDFAILKHAIFVELSEIQVTIDTLIFRQNQ